MVRWLTYAYMAFLVATLLIFWQVSSEIGPFVDAVFLNKSLDPKVVVDSSMHVLMLLLMIFGLFYLNRVDNQLRYRRRVEL